MDNRDFDMRKIPGVEAMIASGVPESCSLAHPWEEIEGLRQQLDAALQERDRLRAALERYGHHEAGPDGCRYEGRGFGGAPCTCGLAALLEIKETPGSEEPPGE